MMDRYESDATTAAAKSAGALTACTPSASTPAQQMTACAQAMTASKRKRPR